jgi:site-specific DNA recombinase
VLAWVTESLRQSHVDEKRHREEAITRLEAEYKRLQYRIDAMYVDKLAGRIDAAFFDRKAAEWRAEQDKCLAAIVRHQDANESYIEEGIRLLELAKSAHSLFEKQEPREKRRLLTFLLSNCSWNNGELTAEYRYPFDLLSKHPRKYEEEKRRGP